MSELSNKYNIPESTIKQMISDGVISCTWAKYEEVYSCYKSLSCSNVDKVVSTVSEKTNVPVRTVYYIIKSFR
jgi:hypothetical protein